MAIRVTERSGDASGPKFAPERKGRRFSKKNTEKAGIVPLMRTPKRLKEKFQPACSKAAGRRLFVLCVSEAKSNPKRKIFKSPIREIAGLKTCIREKTAALINADTAPPKRAESADKRKPRQSSSSELPCTRYAKKSKGR